jgi:hypothetical protein
VQRPALNDTLEDTLGGRIHAPFSTSCVSPDPKSDELGSVSWIVK